MINLNKVRTHALAGLLVGAVIGGIGARLAMRVVALIIGQAGEFSVGGTIFIMLLFGLIGVFFGLIFGAVRPWLPGNRAWQGAIYGAIWAVLFASLFFIAPEGEFGLLGLWLGAAIFAPVMLLPGLALPRVLDPLLARTVNRPPRWVSRSWFTLFVISFVLAFLGMTALVSDAIRLPRAVAQWTESASSNFADLYEQHRFYGMLFLLTWSILIGLIFFRQADTRLGRLAAVALALFAAGWFNVEGMAAVVFDRTGWVDLLSWLLRLIGAGALVGLLVATARSYRQAVDAAVRRQLRPALAGMGIAVGWFGVLWLATLFMPALTFRDGEIFAPLAVTVYLLPWLALPLGVLFPLGKSEKITMSA